MKWYRWIPALAWMGLIFFMSSRQQLPTVDQNGPLDWSWRQAGHLAEYTVLALLFYHALQGGPTGQARLAWALGLAVAYGLSDELHQAFVPGRNSNLEDILFNSTGAGLGILAVWWQQRRTTDPAGGVPCDDPATRPPTGKIG